MLNLLFVDILLTDRFPDIPSEFTGIAIVPSITASHYSADAA